MATMMIIISISITISIVYLILVGLKNPSCLRSYFLLDLAFRWRRRRRRRRPWLCLDMQAHVFWKVWRGCCIHSLWDSDWKRICYGIGCAVGSLFANVSCGWLGFLSWREGERYKYYAGEYEVREQVVTTSTSILWFLALYSLKVEEGICIVDLGVLSLLWKTGRWNVCGLMVSLHSCVMDFIITSIISSSFRSELLKSLFFKREW